MSNQALYFAYGSNLDAADRRRWLRERASDGSDGNDHEDFLDESRELVAPCVFLPGYALSFGIFSRARGGGALTLRRSLAATLVPGALYRPSEAGWRRLDEKEGAPRVYCRVPVALLDARSGGVVVSATSYVARHCEPVPVAPTSAYVECVERGLAAHGAPLEALHAALENVARGQESEAFVLDALFIYGTLMHGERLHGELAPFLREDDARPRAARLVSPASARLYDLGAYPAMVTAPEHFASLGGDDALGSTIRGELVRLREPAAALAALDAVEEFEAPYGDAANEYERVLVRVRCEDSEEVQLAWAYALATRGVSEALRGERLPPRIASGSWRER